MTRTTNTTLGELITSLYDEFLTIYKDEELASVAVAATINDILAEGAIEASRGDPRAIEAA